MDDYIKKLKNDPKVYYIYQTDLSVYGIEDKSAYTVVTNNPEYVNTENVVFYTMPEWFKMIENNTLITWICSGLDKKHIIKEYVKLNIPLDILKLRYNMLESLKYSDYQSYPELEDCLNEMIMDIISLDLTNQIIEHHKIVNLKNSSRVCKDLLDLNDYYSILDKYKHIITKGLEILHKNTDDLYKQNLINKNITN